MRRSRRLNFAASGAFLRFSDDKLSPRVQGVRRTIPKGGRSAAVCETRASLRLTGSRDRYRLDIPCGTCARRTPLPGGRCKNAVS